MTSIDDVCHELIWAEDGLADACDRPAVGVRFDPDYPNEPYPVCGDHLCGGCGFWHDRCTPRPERPERVILLDLIAEIRNKHLGNAFVVGESPSDDPIQQARDWGIGHGLGYAVVLADRAEARLLEVRDGPVP